MTDPTPPQSMSRKDLFLGLIHSFQAAAMQQMGKTLSPFTGKVERDLAQARLSIDMLETLEERTRGNLTPEEARFLKHVLTELRLNYVAESAEGDKGGKGPEGPGGSASAGGPGGPEASSP
jgi:hypothetical protein